MEPDYPAAHSMDTVWYAVDAEGHVAFFHSGEEGCVPVNGVLNDDVVLDWLRARIPGIPREFYPEESDFADGGLFTYGSGDPWDGIVAPYEQNLAPLNPVHIDQVPPAVRDIFRRLRFDGISFRDSQVVQPLECWPCDIYVEDDTGYLAADGATVRALPGKERHFLEDCELRHEAMQRNPELFQGLRFELPREENLPPDEDEEDD
jgi:hypothetical protein